MVSDGGARSFVSLRFVFVVFLLLFFSRPSLCGSIRFICLVSSGVVLLVNSNVCSLTKYSDF